jgi:hypothetical protein
MDFTYVHEVDINNFGHCAQLTNLLFISHLVFVNLQDPILFVTLSFYKVIRERACWGQVGGPQKNGDFNAFLLGTVTMALICQNCGNKKGNLAAYSSSCHPSSQFLNGMETTSLQNLMYSCLTKMVTVVPWLQIFTCGMPVHWMECQESIEK